MITRYYGSRRILECVELSGVIRDNDSLERVISTKISLREWIKQDNNNLELFKNIIIDVDSLIDFEIDDLIENIESIKLLSDAKIILVMSKKDNQYINSLLDNGVYNIIYVNDTDTKTQIANEFRKAFSLGGITKFKEAYEHEKSKAKDIYEKIKKKEELLLELEEETEDLTKKETRKINLLQAKNNQKNIRIAFAGTQANVGNTTLALNLCAFLSRRGLKVAYAENNMNRDLHYITRFYNAPYEDEYYNIDGIHFYVNDLMEKEYDVIVIDYGVLNHDNKNKIFSDHIRFITASFSPKKIVEFNEKRKSWSESKVSVISYDIDESIKAMTTHFSDENISFLKRGSSLFDSLTNEEAWYNNINHYFDAKS